MVERRVFGAGGSAQTERGIDIGGQSGSPAT